MTCTRPSEPEQEGTLLSSPDSATAQRLTTCAGMARWSRLFTRRGFRRTALHEVNAATGTVQRGSRENTGDHNPGNRRRPTASQRHRVKAHQRLSLPRVGDSGTSVRSVRWIGSRRVPRRSVRQGPDFARPDSGTGFRPLSRFIPQYEFSRRARPIPRPAALKLCACGARTAAALASLLYRAGYELMAQARSNELEDITTHCAMQEET